MPLTATRDSDPTNSKCIMQVARYVSIINSQRL